MGITGLLPFLENATRSCHISEFRGGPLLPLTHIVGYIKVPMPVLSNWLVVNTLRLMLTMS
ncbi:hypothetical protein NQ315_013286 [Exocentrus adspersus]|uniref:Uncharacterized protein n=1 Tax=Exocentrus adspersus TaxID=1586481 RepID=A0AAV8VLF3_9CUCU|nr:hypothetical protein NQ315_013286 [Exocentrus adspersus]